PVRRPLLFRVLPLSPLPLHPLSLPAALPICNCPPAHFHRTLQQAPVSPHFATGPGFTALCNTARFHRTFCRARVSLHSLPRAGFTALLAGGVAPRRGRRAAGDVTRAWRGQPW